MEFIFGVQHRYVANTGDLAEILLKCVLAKVISCKM